MGEQHTGLGEIRGWAFPYDIGDGLTVEIQIPYDQMEHHIHSLCEAGIVRELQEGEEMMELDIEVIGVPSETPDLGRG